MKPAKAVVAYISDCIPKNVPADSCKLVIYVLGKKEGGGGGDF